MPLKNFLCPDNVIRPVAQCLEKCSLPERCLSLPTLYECGNDRKWYGNPSTTQLLNPTRMTYLQITCDYTIKPQDRAFALLGVRHHAKLEAVAKRLGMVAEEKLKGEISGILDLIEPCNNNPDEFILYDYKTWGSFAVKKALGSEKKEPDIENATLQLNNYRLMISTLGFKVTKLYVQATVRDGGTFTARQNGIEAKMLKIPIPILPDDKVAEYFMIKRQMLLDSLNNHVIPAMCIGEDNWRGRRCKGFCDVMPFCPEGRMINKLPPLGNNL